MGDVALQAMINNYTFESTALLRRMVKDWSSFHRIKVPYEAPLDYSVTGVSFHTLQNVEERAGFLDMPTSFNLSDEAVDRLRDAAKRILYNSPDFQRLLRDLGGSLPGSKSEPARLPASSS